MGIASPGSELRTTSTPSPRVDLADFVGESQRPRIEDVRDAERLEEGALLRAAGRGENLGTDAWQICNAARPTPPAPAWISTRSPAATRASTFRA